MAAIKGMGRLGLGDACRLFGFTPRALRLYDERGLVRAERDHLNRRYYDDAGRERLAWVAQLRRARISLPDIRSVLEAEDAHGSGWRLAIEKLQARRQDLDDELARVDAEIALLGRAHLPETRDHRLAVSQAHVVVVARIGARAVGDKARLQAG